MLISFLKFIESVFTIATALVVDVCHDAEPFIGGRRSRRKRKEKKKRVVVVCPVQFHCQLLSGLWLQQGLLLYQSRHLGTIYTKNKIRSKISTHVSYYSARLLIDGVQFSAYHRKIWRIHRTAGCHRWRGSRQQTWNMNGKYWNTCPRGCFASKNDECILPAAAHGRSSTQMPPAKLCVPSWRTSYQKHWH